MKASQLKASDARHVCVYGMPKTGKTELVGTLAAKKKLWWFSLDQGHKTLLSQKSAAYPFLDNIELFIIPDSQLFPVAAQTMLKVLRGGLCKVCHAHGVVDCPAPACKLEGNYSEIELKKFTSEDVLVVDHFGQLMDSVMNNIHKEPLAKDNFDIKSDWDDYLKQGNYGDRYGSTIQNAPYHCVVLTQETMANMPDGTKKIAPMGGTRNASADFGKYFDDIVYTEVVGGKFVASCDAGDKSRVVIGSRTGKKLTPNKEGRYSLLELFE